jgi:hypothetical protein
MKKEHRELIKITTEQFNNLPQEKRHEIILHTMSEQVCQLEREKLRLKRSYQRNVKEINDHINNIMRDIKKYHI